MRRISLRGMTLPAAMCAIASVSLSGCASLSEQECLTADWRLLGYEDAMQGRSTATIAQHRRACAAVSVTPDLDLYQQGHLEGARQYCIAANGYRAGSNGGTYQGICPAELEAEFLVAYQNGRELYDLSSEISTLESTIRTYETEIRSFRSDIEELEQEIVARDSTPDRRRANLAEIERLTERITGHEIGISQTQRTLQEMNLEREILTREHRLLGY